MRRYTGIVYKRTGSYRSDGSEYVEVYKKLRSDRISNITKMYRNLIRTGREWNSLRLSTYLVIINNSTQETLGVDILE